MPTIHVKSSKIFPLHFKRHASVRLFVVHINEIQKLETESIEHSNVWIMCFSCACAREIDHHHHHTYIKTKCNEFVVRRAAAASIWCSAWKIYCLLRKKKKQLHLHNWDKRVSTPPQYYWFAFQTFTDVGYPDPHP